MNKQELFKEVQEKLNINEEELNKIYTTLETQLKERDLSLLEIKNLIKNNTKPKKNISIKDVIKLVSDFYNIEEESVSEKAKLYCPTIGGIGPLTIACLLRNVVESAGRSSQGTVNRVQ